MVAVIAYADKAMLYEGESPPCLEISISSIANRFADAVLGEQPMLCKRGLLLSVRASASSSVGNVIFSNIQLKAPQRGNTYEPGNACGAQNQCRRESGHAVGVFQYGDRPQT